MALKDDLSAIESEMQELRKRKVALEEREFAEVILPDMKSRRGTHYKYRNSYSCPSKASDYWWMYVKVVGVDDGMYVIHQFQRDSYGKVQISTDTRPHWAFGESSGYVPIKRSEFVRAVRPMLNEVAQSVSAKVKTV